MNPSTPPCSSPAAGPSARRAAAWCSATAGPSCGEFRTRSLSAGAGPEPRTSGSRPAWETAPSGGTGLGACASRRQKSILSSYRLTSADSGAFRQRAGQGAESRSPVHTRRLRSPEAAQSKRAGRSRGTRNERRAATEGGPLLTSAESRGAPTRLPPGQKGGSRCRSRPTVGHSRSADCRAAPVSPRFGRARARGAGSTSAQRMKPTRPEGRRGSAVLHEAAPARRPPARPS